MTKNKHSSLFLVVVSTASTALALLFLLLWVINLEVAVRLFFADFTICQNIVPSSVYRWALTCAADLSTVSTLVPLLMFIFPAVQGFRAFARSRANSDEELIWRPYPPHFAFFLIMLGLTGTLYGLLIGLQSSGVESVAANGLSGAAIQDSVQRLLAGTATAVLSSLVGLIGAFFAARPLSWIFCLSLPLDIAEELPEDLEATVDHLCEGLGRMDRTVREVTRSLEPIPLDQLAQQLGRLESQNQELVTGVSKMCAALDRCADGLASMTGIEQKLEHAVTGLADLRSDQAKSVEALNASIVAAGDHMESAVSKQTAGQAAVIETLQDLGKTVREGNQQRQQGQSRLSKAFAMFAEEQDNG